MASDIRHLQCILFVWSWFHWTLKQMISDTGCQHDSSQLLSCHYDRTRTGTSHVHIKSNGHTTLVITNTMELDKARSFYNGCFHTRIPPPCKQCCQVRLHKQTTKTDAFFLTCKLPPSCLTWNITYIPKLISFFFFLSKERELNVYSNGRFISTWNWNLSYNDKHAVRL